MLPLKSTYFHKFHQNRWHDGGQILSFHISLVHPRKSVLHRIYSMLKVNEYTMLKFCEFSEEEKTARILNGKKLKCKYKLTYI